MTDTNYTALGLLVDRSGSMGMVQEAAQKAINDFLTQQAELTGRADIWFSDFDDRYQQIERGTSIKVVKTYTLNPRGMTALYDAMGKLITTMGEDLAAKHEDKRPGKVLFAIVTDGHENHSTEWGRKRVFDLVAQQRDRYAWEFMYLSSDPAAVADAQAINIDRGHTHILVNTAGGMRAGGQSMSTYASRYRDAEPVFWADEGQKLAKAEADKINEAAKEDEDA